jgi:hypothetical protein
MEIAPILTGEQWVVGYHAKKDFHYFGALFLRSLADRIGLQRGTHHVRSNLGGDAVSGEIYLRHDKLYMWITQSFDGQVLLIYRACNGRRDSIGEQNNTIKLIDMKDDARAAELVQNCQRIISRSSS